MSDNYQAVYDAVRQAFPRFDSSRISDIIREAFDVSYAKARVEQEVNIAINGVKEEALAAIGSISAEMQRPSVLFRPELCVSMTHSPPKWSAHYKGLDFQRGATPEEAMRNFDKAWSAQ